MLYTKSHELFFSLYCIIVYRLDWLLHICFSFLFALFLPLSCFIVSPYAFSCSPLGLCLFGFHCSWRDAFRLHVLLEDG